MKLICGVDKVLAMLKNEGREVLQVYVKTLLILSISNPNYLGEVIGYS